jgi:hypothetical protein
MNLIRIARNALDGSLGLEILFRGRVTTKECNALLVVDTSKEKNFKGW